MNPGLNIPNYAQYQFSCYNCDLLSAENIPLINANPNFYYLITELYLSASFGAGPVTADQEYLYMSLLTDGGAEFLENYSIYNKEAGTPFVIAPSFEFVRHYVPYMIVPPGDSLSYEMFASPEPEIFSCLTVRGYRLPTTLFKLGYGSSGGKVGIGLPLDLNGGPID